MDSILRAICIYFLLLVLLRITGRRVLGELTTFDFVLTLIMSETIQNSLVGEDISMTNSLLILSTLLSLEVALSRMKSKFPFLDRILEGKPIIVYEKRSFNRNIMNAEGITEEDLVQACRTQLNKDSLESVYSIILETNGSLSVISRE
jgi:uncharacterized membrane protein YcaP (DUF421 family)